MREFDSAFDFYSLPQRERKHMIGQCFMEKQRQDRTKDAIYFPIGLTKDGGLQNYGVRQGVLRVALLTNYLTKEPWLRVSCFSPDDLDKDLDFHNPEPGLRDKVIAYIKVMGKLDRTYDDALEELQKQFGGERTS